MFDKITEVGSGESAVGDNARSFRTVGYFPRFTYRSVACGNIASEDFLHLVSSPYAGNIHRMEFKRIKICVIRIFVHLALPKYYITFKTSAAIASTTWSGVISPVSITTASSAALSGAISLLESCSSRAAISRMTSSRVAFPETSPC